MDRAELSRWLLIQHNFRIWTLIHILDDKKDTIRQDSDKMLGDCYRQKR